MIQPPSTVIRNGTIVTAESLTTADLRIEGERITEIALSISGRPGDEVVDARGLLVLPGGVDPHVHLTRRPSLPTDLLGPEDLTSSSHAALAGGVTTVGEIASPDPAEGVCEVVDRVERDVRSMALVDIFVHPVLGSTTHKADQVSALPNRGQPSLKIFLMDPSLAADAAGLRRVVQRAAEAGVTVLFHCESHEALAEARRGLLEQRRSSLRFLPESRPKAAEIRATRQAIALCRDTGATGYIVHISCDEALRLCIDARSEGLPIHTETRPEFLHLTAERHRGPDAKLFVIIPPLRDEEDRHSLWKGVADASIDVVATDDAGFWSEEQKLAAPDTFEDLWMGVSGLELFRPLLYSEGVVKERISAERFVEITSTAAARIFGLFPRKGTIAVGSDADVVLWDPNLTRTVRSEDMFSRTGFSIYEGRAITGWPTMTFLRGRRVYASGEILGSPGCGRLIPRSSTGDGTAPKETRRPRAALVTTYDIRTPNVKGEASDAHP